VVTTVAAVETADSFSINILIPSDTENSRLLLVFGRAKSGEYQLDIIGRGILGTRISITDTEIEDLKSKLNLVLQKATGVTKQAPSHDIQVRWAREI
jgi:hypothetical protein